MAGGSMCDPSCASMMEKEMRAYPWKMAYAAAFGVLSLTALALLVILEVLWIRLWSRRLALLATERASKE